MSELCIADSPPSPCIAPKSSLPRHGVATAGSYAPTVQLRADGGGAVSVVIDDIISTTSAGPPELGPTRPDDSGTTDDRLSRGQVRVHRGGRNGLRIHAHERLRAAEADEEPRPIIGEEFEAVVGRERLRPNDRPTGQLGRSLLGQLDQEPIFEGRIDRPIEMDVHAAVAGGPSDLVQMSDCAGDGPPPRIAPVSIILGPTYLKPTGTS